MAKKATAKSRPRSGAKAATAERSQGRRARAEEEVRVRQTQQGVKHGARYAAETCYIEDDGKAGSQVDPRQSSPNGALEP